MNKFFKDSIFTTVFCLIKFFSFFTKTIRKLFSIDKMIHTSLVLTSDNLMTFFSFFSSSSLLSPFFLTSSTWAELFFVSSIIFFLFNTTFLAAVPFSSGADFLFWPVVSETGFVDNSLSISSS